MKMSMFDNNKSIRKYCMGMYASSKTGTVPDGTIIDIVTLNYKGSFSNHVKDPKLQIASI